MYIYILTFFTKRRFVKLLEIRRQIAKKNRANRHKHNNLKYTHLYRSLDILL